MGASTSKITTGGALPSATPPPATTSLDRSTLPSLHKKKTYGARVPDSVKDRTNGKQVMTVAVDGKEYSIKIPPNLKAGDEFTFDIVYKETDKVYTSTLHALPNMEIVQAGPMIFGSVSLTYRGGVSNESMGGQVGKLMNDAQSKIIEVCMEKQQYNAVLGMNFNVTNDSSGEHGQFKTVIVTCCGTPCVVVEKKALGESNPTNSISTIPTVYATAPALAAVAEPYADA